MSILEPIEKEYKELEEKYLKVRTLPQQMKKDAIASVRSEWLGRQAGGLAPFSLWCSAKAQINLAFDLRSSYTEPWVTNPSYQTNEKYPRQAQVFFIGWGGRVRTCV